MKNRLLAIVGVIAAASVVAHTQAIDTGKYQLVDLSHAYGPSTVYWPTAPAKFVLRRDAGGKTDGGFYYASNTLSTPEHGGTHLDAPRHFSATGRTAAP